MPREYEVTKKPNLYADPLCGSDEKSKYISYRMVICHAVHNLILHGTQKQQIFNLVYELCNKLSSGDFVNDNFLEIRHMKDCSDILVIDKTDGTYPLVLRDGSMQEDPDRVYAFKKSAEDIYKSFENVYKILSGSEEFNQQVHEQLVSILNFPKDDNTAH